MYIRTLRNIAFTITLALFILPFLARAQSTDAAPVEFKVGDRVEVRAYGDTWEPGVVTHGLEHNCYKVALDKFAKSGGGYDSIAVPQDVRALADGSKAPAALPFPPEREPIKDPVQEPAKAGTPPLEAMVRLLIQSHWETNPEPHQVANVDVKTVQIGKPRAFRPLQDNGVIGDDNTIIYPVMATYTIRNYLNTGGTRVVIYEYEGLFNVYINSFDHWECGLVSSKEVKPMQSIEKPAAK